MPGNIDLLIGAGMWANIINDYVIRKGTNENIMVAQSTSLGWVVSGHADACNHIRLLSCHIAADSQDARLDKLLLHFWKADDLPEKRPDERRAEEIFKAEHSRDRTGRYVVRIPLKKDHRKLGVSRNVAKARFLATERKFAHNPELFKQYKTIFDDYRSKKQMVLAPEAMPKDSNMYYLSHHAINAPTVGNCSFGQDKKKGKFRVVFDPSVPSSNGVSSRSVR